MCRYEVEYDKRTDLTGRRKRREGWANLRTRRFKIIYIERDTPEKIKKVNKQTITTRVEWETDVKSVKDTMKHREKKLRVPKSCHREYTIYKLFIRNSLNIFT